MGKVGIFRLLHRFHGETISLYPAIKSYNDQECVKMVVDSADVIGVLKISELSR